MSKISQPHDDHELETMDHILDFLRDLSPGARERVVRALASMLASGNLAWAVGFQRLHCD